MDRDAGRPEVIPLSHKPYDKDCHKRFEPACRLVMERILTRRGNRIMTGDESVDAVVARMTPKQRSGYAPKRHPELDLLVTDIVVEHPWFGIRMYELEARWKDQSGRSHFWELHRYHFYGLGSYNTVHVPERKVVNGNVSDLYIGFSPMLKWLYVIPMDLIREHHERGDIDVRPCYAHGIHVRDDRFVEVPNVPDEVTFVRIRPSSGPGAVGLTFDPGSDRWLLPS